MNAHPRTSPLVLPPQEDLHRLFEYDAERGILIRRFNPDIPNRINKRCAGKPAGYADARGYVQVAIERKLYLAHRVIWKMAHGTDPPKFIDHRDGNPSNNRLENLRAADHAENMANRGRIKGKELPRSIFKMRDGFQVKLSARKKRIHVGTFATLDEAREAQRVALVEYFGTFARLDDAP